MLGSGWSFAARLKLLRASGGGRCHPFRVVVCSHRLCAGLCMGERCGACSLRVCVFALCMCMGLHGWAVYAWRVFASEGGVTADRVRGLCDRAVGLCAHVLHVRGRCVDAA